MYQIKVHEESAVIELAMSGFIQLPEMEQLVRELTAATLRLAGRDIRILADARRYVPATREAAALLRSVQEFGLRSGVKRVAELVESQLVAIQLNRVARESGTDRILRRFWEAEPARQWLLQEDAQPTAPEGQAHR